jgi:hypothetical protein
VLAVDNDRPSGSGMNIWVGITDLFAGLLLVVLVGLIVVTGRYYQLLKERNLIAEELIFSRELQRAVNEAVRVNSLIQKRLQQSLPQEMEKPTFSELEISIPSVVLFRSFSYDDFLRDDGRRRFLTLVRSAIAEAMGSLGDRSRYLRMVIEGHTDSDPILRHAVTEAIPTNWELSSRRATGVLRFFKEAGLAPEDFEMVAVGLADTEPVGDNRTEAGKDQNRRIVIRIEPNLERIRRNLLEREGASDLGADQRPVG